MRSPGFWQRDGVLPMLLAPVAMLYARATARRVARPGWRAPVPVICCGNATAGGAGKTTLALDVGARLLARGYAVAFLTRGYGGTVAGPVRVDRAVHGAGDVGDEALLLAEMAPTYVAADRAAAARLAVRDGAERLVMDDGLQNPSLYKDLSFLVVDGEAGFGNRRVIPAGPLREPVAAAAARCKAAVVIGEDRTGAMEALPVGLPVVRAVLRSGIGAELLGRKLFAFAGIGRPEKFFDSLRAAGADIAGEMAFADHHPFSEADVRRVFAAAEAAGAYPVTTPKDAVRFPARAQVGVIGVQLVWDDAAALERLLP